ncbi:hypothetical protein C3L21_22900 (plasmid) [Sinorhizobium meliloti]|nr:hypothetical protein C3L21_22900 [Sinorhizobium meliloti]
MEQQVDMSLAEKVNRIKGDALFDRIKRRVQILYLLRCRQICLDLLLRCFLGRFWFIFGDPLPFGGFRLSAGAPGAVKHRTPCRSFGWPIEAM